MKYREKILEIIANGDDAALLAWIGAQPLLEQTDIMRELRELGDEINEELEETGEELIPDLEKMDAMIDLYEDKILDEKLAEANLIMALEQQEKTAKQMFEAVIGMREYVIECITTNAPNAAQMRELSQHIIKFEKDAGVYNPENWKAIGL
jgi:hypothetical protein